jgi:hypothetical protein
MERQFGAKLRPRENKCPSRYGNKAEPHQNFSLAKTNAGYSPVSIMLTSEEYIGGGLGVFEETWY